MSNSYREIDEEIWERARQCMIFRNSVESDFCIMFEADITEFRQVVKEKGLSLISGKVHHSFVDGILFMPIVDPNSFWEW